MNRQQLHRYVISPEEKAIRKIICDMLPAYEAQGYRFHNESGHFVERVLKHMQGNYARIRSSIYVTLLGCYCKDDALSVPCKVRKEIEDEILAKFIVEVK